MKSLLLGCSVLIGLAAMSAWAHQPRAAAADSPEAAWAAVLAAMKAEDLEALKNAATEQGYQSLVMTLKGEQRSARDLHGLADVFTKWPLHFSVRNDDRAEASMGPEVKAHGLKFVRAGEGWKLDQWMPGE